MKPLALVVENDGGTRKLLDAVLSRAGFDVDLVSGSAGAVLLLGIIDYDIILLDLLFPGGSGEDVLRWLAEYRPAAVPKVVVMSSAPDHIIENVRRQWSDVRTLRKPFDLADIFGFAESAARPRPRAVTRAEKFCRRSICAGAKAGVVVRRHDDFVDLVTSYGYAPGVAESWYPAPLSSAMPICAAMRNARPVWLASLTLAQPEYPLLVPVWEQYQSRAFAAVPLLRDGIVIGAAGWSFREPRLFNEAEQRSFTAIADLAADMIEPGEQSAANAGA
ncbi:MAG TPA: GAF domain-containing protein [Thermoanaerobaculia bacterium]|nr:GAF domain-containing protein [Thermoanaerobaculia bacterium]